MAKQPLTFGLDVDASGINGALRQFRAQIARLSPRVSRCIRCGAIKDGYGNHVRHFWYEKYTAKILPFNPRCNYCNWPCPHFQTRLVYMITQGEARKRYLLEPIVDGACKTRLKVNGLVVPE